LSATMLVQKMLYDVLPFSWIRCWNSRPYYGTNQCTMLLQFSATSRWGPRCYSEQIDTTLFRIFYYDIIQLFIYYSFYFHVCILFLELPSYIIGWPTYKAFHPTKKRQVQNINNEQLQETKGMCLYASWQWYLDMMKTKFMNH
jgi:hypothetical protein